jgi:transglutaminase-like putative cysteine protease
MVDPDNGMVVNIISAPGEYVRGLCFDGEDLWAADDHLNELHRITRSDDEKMKRSNKREARITYIHQITNFGPGDLLSATINLALPEDRDNQIIHDDSVVPAGDIALITDQWGQQSVQVTARDIPPGESFEAEMDIHATIYEIRYFIDPDKVGDISEAPLEVREKFLADNEKYRIDDPIIQDALAQCVGEETNPYWIARSIYNYLLENMYYEMAGGWNTAPAVLERGNGSCSEYTFVFIAMCRGAGIPARYVGSVVVRGDEASYDDVFHRWAEIYLPGYGWVPFDPSGGDNKWPRDQANYIGHLSNRFLITTQSGGGSMALEWTYNSNAWWQTEPKTYVVEDKYADWEPIK